MFQANWNALAQDSYIAQKNEKPVSLEGSKQSGVKKGKAEETESSSYRILYTNEGFWI